MSASSGDTTSFAGPRPSPGGGVAIRIEHLTKHYNIYETPWHRLKQALFRGERHYHDQIVALDDVGFEVGRGETYGIVGRNGSGKSTLLQIVAGTLAPTSGTVRINGRVAALLELGAGFHPDFTGRENVELFCALTGLSPEQTAARFDDIADFAEIGPFLDQPVRTLSSGMYVRLAFAAAINVDPDILIVDEALSVGDAAFQRKCYARLAALKQAGATILFVSHSEAAVLELCDRALLLHQGRVLREGTPKEVISLYQRVLYLPNWQQAVETAGEAAPVAATPTTDRAGAGAPDGAASDGAYDPNLVSKSRVEYPSDGAVIEAPRITTLDGRQVNRLHRRHVYRYGYTVRFTRDARNVRCGMLVKTKSGLELSASGTSGPDDLIPEVKAGTVATVSFRFTCLLLPGSYFCNAGCSETPAGEATRFLHRIVDALMFHVVEETSLALGHTVDLLYAPEVDLTLPDGRVVPAVRDGRRTGS
jgi:lipopolysaccharide transport system ATP-binding protein